LDSVVSNAKFVALSLQWQLTLSPVVTLPVQWLDWSSSPDTPQEEENPFAQDSIRDKNMKLVWQLHNFLL